MHSLGKTLLAFALLHYIPRPNLSVNSGISSLPPFVFQSPMMKRISLFGLVLEGLVKVFTEVDLQLYIQKTKIISSGPITSWEIDGETVGTVSDFIFLGSKITADGDQP